jgi:molybdenum cofactor sulfurtransferase
MICVDQETAEKNEEPFVTLARTRRFDSKVFFGVHMSLVGAKGEKRQSQFPTVMIGERVVVDAVNSK